jgi:hypothetical protein
LPPSGDTVIPEGDDPTVTVPIMAFDAVSMIEILPPDSFAT